MDLLRYSRDAWGQETLEGVSWDLLGLVVGMTLAVIVLHALYARLFARRDEKKGTDPFSS